MTSSDLSSGPILGSSSGSSPPFAHANIFAAFCGIIASEIFSGVQLGYWLLNYGFGGYPDYFRRAWFGQAVPAILCFFASRLKLFGRGWCDSVAAIVSAAIGLPCLIYFHDDYAWNDRAVWNGNVNLQICGFFFTSLAATIVHISGRAQLIATRDRDNQVVVHRVASVFMSLLSAVYLFVVRYAVVPDLNWNAFHKCQIAFSVIGGVLLMFSGVAWRPIVSGGVQTDEAQPSVWRIAIPFVMAVAAYHLITVSAELYHRIIFRVWRLPNPVSAAWLALALFQVGAVVGAAASIAPIFRGSVGWASAQLLAAIAAAGIGLCTNAAGLAAAWCITGLGFGAMRAASFTLLGEAVCGEEVPLNVGVFVSLGVIGQQFGAVLYEPVRLVESTASAWFSAIIVLAGLLAWKKSSGHSE